MDNACIHTYYHMYSMTQNKQFLFIRHRNKAMPGSILKTRECSYPVPRKCKKKKAIVMNMGQITDCVKGLYSTFLPEKQQHPWTLRGDMFKDPSSISRSVGEHRGQTSAMVHRSSRPHTHFPFNAIDMLKGYL